MQEMRLVFSIMDRFKYTYSEVMAEDEELVRLMQVEGMVRDAERR